MKKIFFAAALIFACSAAFAADKGDIAIIEDVDGTIVSSFTGLNLSKAACALYKDHQDIYDAIIIFYSGKLPLMFNTPSGYAVKAAQKGIGRDPAVDMTKQYCAANSRLKHSMNMAEIDGYPADPDDYYTKAVDGVYTGIEVIAHEFGHYWLALPMFKQDGNMHCYLRAFMNSSEPKTGDCDGYAYSEFGLHWSYLFNARSPMFGSFIDDLGDGTFKIYSEHPKYSPFDQYLMGLRSPESVPAMFVVNTGNYEKANNTPLPPGESEIVEGERIDFTVQDVIAAMGERVPPRDPCHWKAAFVIVHPKGSPPSNAQVSRVDAYRQRWETFYDWATDNKGSADTTINGRGTGTGGCPGSPTYPDGGVVPDGSSDSGAKDAAFADAGFHDSGAPDGGTKDSGITDGGTSTDSGATDASVEDDAQIADSGTDASGPGPVNPVVGCSCSAIML
ncbi:MAG: hypothetical protein WC889_16505 [Myxococcota bacterium]|jgi:hypothetical protein